MSAIELVIEEITKSPHGALEIDYMIALVMGWKRVEKRGAASGASKSSTVWLDPFGGENAKIPSYSRNLQDAFSLALQVAPHTNAGCGWESGKSSAQFVEHPPFLAATPQLAICGASIDFKRRNRI